MKLIVAERESPALRAYLEAQDGRFVSSALLRTESMRAVRHVSSDALSLVRDGLRRMDLIDVDDRVLEAAGTIAPEILRTLDAIHLATAIQIGDDLRAIVSYDDRMIDAASLLGLPTARPS
jgi:predicted nucleic acid-binding protein